MKQEGALHHKIRYRSNTVFFYSSCIITHWPHMVEEMLCCNEPADSISQPSKHIRQCRTHTEEGAVGTMYRWRLVLQHKNVHYSQACE